VRVKYHKVFLFFRDTNMVKGCYNIKFHIELGFTKTCENLLDQRQEVAILNYNNIKGLIIYAKTESYIRFFSE
jgi:hypothetical protein